MMNMLKLSFITFFLVNIYIVFMCFYTKASSMEHKELMKVIVGQIINNYKLIYAKVMLYFSSRMTSS